jgi:hypothetical protein
MIVYYSCIVALALLIESRMRVTVAAAAMALLAAASTEAKRRGVRGKKPKVAPGSDAAFEEYTRGLCVVLLSRLSRLCRHSASSSRCRKASH